MTLITDESRPGLRAHIGRLLSRCTHAEIAVGTIRLAAIDLTEHETAAVQGCRILIGRLDARALADFGFVDAGTDTRLGVLLDFIRSGRVQVRSAGLGAWSPDFSLYRGLTQGRDTCLLGAHYFREPPAHHGPSFTATLTDPNTIASALQRFESLWSRSHDAVEPVVSAILRRQSDCAA